MNKFCWYIINSGRLPLFQLCFCDLNFLTENWLQICFRGGCSLVLRFLHNSHSCTVLSHLLRISFSSVRHFLDLSWIVEDLPCFSEVRSFTSWYALLLLFLFRQVSVSLHWAPIQSSIAFFTAFWILLFASLYSFAPSASYHFFKSRLSSQRSKTSLVTHGFFLGRSFPSIYLAVL